MTWNTRTALAALVLGTALAVNAQTTTVRYDRDRNTETERVRWVDREHDWCTYKANELSFDFFGTGTVGKETLRNPSSKRIDRDGTLGGGIGMEYFFHRNFGIEAEAYTESTHNNWVDNINGNLVARLPLGDSGVAPYIFAGGGRSLDPVYQWQLDAGGGLEWRFAPHTGVFVDARYVWAEETRDYGLGRVGLRFGF
jgi:hypothetical protein